MRKGYMFRKANRNGHPVSQGDYNLVSPQEKDPKEACDVQPEYSTLFPLPSNPNYQPNLGPGIGPYRSHPRQTVSSHLPSLRSTVRSYPQLDRTTAAGSQSGFDPGL